MQEIVACLLPHACELLACIQHSGLSVMGNGGETGSGGVTGSGEVTSSGGVAGCGGVRGTNPN